MNRRILAWIGVALAWLFAGSAWAEPAAHYRIDTRFDVPGGTLASTVTVELPTASPEVHFLLGRRFTLDGVEAGPGAKVAVSEVERPIPALHEIAITGAVRKITFRYHGRLDREGADDAGLSPDRMEIDLETMWLPVRADLSMPFTLDAKLSGLPEGLDVMAEGQLARQGDMLTIHRTNTDNDLTLVGARGLKLVKAPDVEFYASDPDDPLIAMLRKHAFGAAAYYHRLYGAPDPTPIRMVIVPRASGAGYARRSFVVMPTFRKMGDPTPPFDESSPARFVSHEFRHAWGATPSTVWSDYWMSESVAEYFALRYVEATLGRPEMDKLLERKRKPAETAGPLIGVDRKPSGAGLYQKGVVLLFDLEARIGRDKLDRILVRRDPPDTTPEFLAALAEAAGPDVAREFEAKLR
jgi:hypothetical protein